MNRYTKSYNFGYLSTDYRLKGNNKWQSIGLANFMTKKYVKSCFSVKKIDFEQQTACGAPVRWSKYTTENHTPLVRNGLPFQKYNLITLHKGGPLKLEAQTIQLCIGVFWKKSLGNTAIGNAEGKAPPKMVFPQQCRALIFKNETLLLQ